SGLLSQRQCAVPRQVPLRPSANFQVDIPYSYIEPASTEIGGDQLDFPSFIALHTRRPNNLLLQQLCATTECRGNSNWHSRNRKSTRCRRRRKGVDYLSRQLLI